MKHYTITIGEISMDNTETKQQKGYKDDARRESVSYLKMNINLN